MAAPAPSSKGRSKRRTKRRQPDVGWAAASGAVGVAGPFREVGLAAVPVRSTPVERGVGVGVLPRVTGMRIGARERFELL